MKTNILFLIAALLGTALVACQKEEPIDRPDEIPSDETGWTLTIQASMDVDTKAMDLSGNTLKSYWKKGEKVSVYFGDALIGTLEVTSDTNTDPTADATLSGTISVAGIGVNSVLSLVYPGRDDNEWSYVGQDGSAPSADGSMATKFDYASATLTVSDLDSSNHTVTADATKFTFEQSIYRLGFLAGSTDNIAVKSITVTSNQDKLVRTRSFNADTWTSTYGSLTVNPIASVSDNLYYMSIRNENTSADDIYSFSVIGSDDALYVGTKTIGSSHLGYGKFLSTKKINVAKKTMASSSSSISSEIEVL